MKKLLLVLILIVAIVVIAGAFLITNLGSIVEAGVEKGGSHVLGVSTELDAVNISILDGEVGLDGFRMGSPQGFTAPDMFRLNHAGTKVELDSLLGDEIVVREVVVDGAQVTLEFAGGKTNWGALMERLQGEPSAEAPAPEEEKPAEPAPAKSQKKIRVDHILFSNGKVTLAGLPGVQTASVPLPRVEIRDLESGGGGGMAPAELVSKVVSELYKAIVTAATDILPAEQLANLGKEAGAVLGEASEAAMKAGEAAKEQALEAAGKATGTVGEAGEKAGETVKGAADKAKDALGGIFGGGED